MSTLEDALAAMTTAIESLADAADLVRQLEHADAEYRERLGRVRRRLENGGAQVELDRRIVGEIRAERELIG